MASGGRQSRVLSLVDDLTGLVHQQDRNAVLDPVDLPQSGVVKLGSGVQQRAAVGRAHKNPEQLLIQHRGA